MLVCRECGSLQFSDVGRYCPACGSDSGFDSEGFSHSPELESEDIEEYFERD